MKTPHLQLTVAFVHSKDGMLFIELCESLSWPIHLLFPCRAKQPYVDATERHACTVTGQYKKKHSSSDWKQLLQHATCWTHFMWRQTCKSQMHALLKGVDAWRENPWARWELFWDPFSLAWVFCLPCEGSSLFCGGRFSFEINEKLHLSHEKSIFTIYLTLCIPRAHIRRCWLMLAYSSVFWCIHRHCWDLLWVSRPLQTCPLSLFAFLMFTVGKLIRQSRDEIWHTTGSQKDSLNIVSIIKLPEDWVNYCPRKQRLH